jgi:hypothetical protein
MSTDFVMALSTVSRGGEGLATGISWPERTATRPTGEDGSHTESCVQTPTVAVEET